MHDNVQLAMLKARLPFSEKVDLKHFSVFVLGNHPSWARPIFSAVVIQSIVLLANFTQPRFCWL